MKKILSTSFALLMIALALVIVNGCKKTEPQPQEVKTETPQAEEDVDIEQALKNAGIEITPEMKATIDEAQSRVEQTICPIMGGKILKDVFVEYKGQKVYFCCAGCEKSFNEDPEKYLSKLPQFGGKE
jgi:YHS domain-containing protein